MVSKIQDSKYLLDKKDGTKLTVEDIFKSEDYIKQNPDYKDHTWHVFSKFTNIEYKYQDGELLPLI